MQQLITPNPHIPCTPGWCLQYVRQAYGLDGVHPTATAGWNASPTQHQDRDFPSGCWIPVWFSLANEPAGHVALMAPDGSVYSTSDLTNVPHHHPSLDDLIHYYDFYGMPLGYRGWTEDIEDVAVITGAGISVEGAITPTQEDDMPITAEDAALIAGHVWNFDYQVDGRPAKPLWLLQSMDAIIRETIAKTAAATAQVILSTELPNVLTGGKTSLGLETSWDSYNVQALKDDVKPEGISEAEFATILQEGIDKAVSGLTITLSAQKDAQ